MIVLRLSEGKGEDQIGKYAKQVKACQHYHLSNCQGEKCLLFIFCQLRVFSLIFKLKQA